MQDIPHALPLSFSCHNGFPNIGCHHRSLNSSLWELAHKEDQQAIESVLSRVILTRKDPAGHVNVRLKTSFDDHYVGFRAGFKCGTQGIHCTLWPTRERRGGMK
jgi:hypothetical protein